MLGVLSHFPHPGKAVAVLKTHFRDFTRIMGNHPLPVPRKYRSVLFRTGSSCPEVMKMAGPKNGFAPVSTYRGKAFSPAKLIQ